MQVDTDERQNWAVLARARSGDGEAFRELVEPYRRELHLHCYRILGSVQDAEDTLQETLLAAWRGLDTFQERASVRTWLYRIATNRCLNARRDRARSSYTPDVPLPEPTRWTEPSWLEPYPDVLLAGLPDAAPGPDARYETKESVSLAFVAAVQSLPPRQRAVVVLRDVLGYRASEVAELLDTTEDSVTSALKRARSVLPTQPPVDPAGDDAVVARFAEAFEDGDVDAIVALLTADARLTMPPVPMEYQGTAAVTHFLATIALRDGRRFRLVPAGANGQPGFGCYLRDPHAAVAHAHGLLVLTMAGDRVSACTRFLDNALLPHFGLPLTLPE
jgi:RNA polymerase sigma-70 factor (ECF subfamily)